MSRLVSCFRSSANDCPLDGDLEIASRAALGDEMFVGLQPVGLQATRSMTILIKFIFIILRRKFCLFILHYQKECEIKIKLTSTI